MFRKFITVAALLAMLLTASVPVLAQQDSGEESSFEPFLGGPDGDDLFISGDQAIGCGSVFGIPSGDPFEEISSPVGTSPEVVEEAQRLCLENGYTPNISSTGIQYDTGEPGRCFERQADGFCSGYVAPDGSVIYAQPAY